MTRTYGELELHSDKWVIRNLEPHVAIRLKQLFPRVPKATAEYYVITNTPSFAADLQWFTARYPLRISADHLDALTNGRLSFEATQNDLERVLGRDYQPSAFAGIRDGWEVRNYQAQAADVLERSKGLLLGDEVGLGKTFVACAAMLRPTALPAIVVCQAHLQVQWRKVIEAFTTLRARSIKTTTPHALDTADVFVFRYSQLLGWTDMFRDMEPGLVAFDEVQELRTGMKSQKGVAAKALADQAGMRLGLSATPIYNYGVEIHNIMKFINEDVLGSFGDFEREWMSGGAVKDPKALGTYLREQYCFLRRTKHEVGKEMPAVNRIVEFIDHDDEVEDIDDLAIMLSKKVTTGSFMERGQAARELDLLVRQWTGVSKAKTVAQYVRILVEGGEPVVLVGWHREVYDIWLRELEDLKPAMYTGSETPSGKNRSKESFVNGDTDILIMSLRTAAGLDGLQQRASTMVFGELDWSPGVHHQCIGRLDREGQTEPVTAIFLVTEEGSDPPMMEVLGIKASQAASIIDPHLGVQAVHSDMTHVQRLVDRYLKKRKTAKLEKEPELAL